MEEHARKRRESISIDGFFSFINLIYSRIDARATFKSWRFYKERVLYNYEEDELKSELIPITSFEEMLPGSRIFWIGSLEVNGVEVRVDAIFNVSRDGQTILEAIYPRGATGLSVADIKDKTKMNRLWRTTKALFPIVIPVIGEVIRSFISSS